MQYDLFILILRYLVTAIYCIIFIINIIFAFSLEKYQRLNTILETEIFTLRALTQLEVSNIDIDEWLFAHHRIAGLLLSFLSLFDACMLNRLFLRL